MAASTNGTNVNAIVKLLSEKSAADVRQGSKLLRDFLHEHGSSGRNELLQWGVVHSIMTLLTEAWPLSFCPNQNSSNPSSFGS